MKQHQVFWHYSFDRVGYEHLVAIELYLVAVGVDGFAHFGEVEYAREVERVVDVEMNLEQRILKVNGVEFVVELLVVVVG